MQPVGSAAEALTTLRQRKVNLLFTDIGLVGAMDGRRLAEEARAIDPALKVLFTSGNPVASAEAALRDMLGATDPVG